MVTTFIFALLFGLSPYQADSPSFRLPHPLAPSLPQLSDAEEDELDGIIDRFMLFDVGRLPGPAGQQALKQFEALKSDAIPALLRGLARSARLDHDCPVTVIARRLRDLLLRSTDRTLLAFARDEVDSVDLRRHRGIVTDLKVRLTGRLALLDRSNTPEPPLYRDEKLAGLTVADIKKMLANNPDAVTARAVLGELATRKEPEVLLICKEADGEDAGKHGWNRIEREKRKPRANIKPPATSNRREDSGWNGDQIGNWKGDGVDEKRDRQGCRDQIPHWAILREGNTEVRSVQ